MFRAVAAVRAKAARRSCEVSGECWPRVPRLHFKAMALLSRGDRRLWLGKGGGKA